MKLSTYQRSFRLDPELNKRVAAFAASEGRSISDIVRLALEQYLLGQKLLNESHLRSLQMIEYSQAALSIIIGEDHPEFRDRILTDVPRRMERYHGTR